MQGGRSLQVDGDALLQVAGDEPLTVAVWRGDEPGTIHVQAQQSLAPHAPALDPAQISLTVMSSSPITRVLCGDAELSVRRDGERYTIG